MKRLVQSLLRVRMMKGMSTKKIDVAVGGLSRLFAFLMLCICATRPCCLC